MDSAAIVDRRLDVAWQMLATLGAPASAEPIASNPVDPECAILLGGMCASDDPRIGEATRWLLKAAHRSLSVSRMKTVATLLGDHATDGTAFIGAAATGVSSLRQWERSFAIAPAARSVTSDANDDRLSHRIGANEITVARLSHPGAFRLRMRMAFGVGARTEALSALLVRLNAASAPDRAWLSVPQLEHATGFGKRHLLDQLPDMSRAGLLDHARDGRTHRFRARPEILTAVEPVPTRWLDWIAHVAMLLDLEDAMRILEANPTAAGAMDAARRLADRPDVLPLSFDPYGIPETLPDRLYDWLLTSARHIAAIDP